MIRPILLAAAFLPAAPLAAQPAPASSVRAGDDQFTCAQLTAETAHLQGELDAMTSEVWAAAQQQIQAARAQQAAATASALASNIPIVGGLLGQLGSAAAGAATDAQQDRLLILSERMLTRGSELAQRINRIEILRAARCAGTAGAAPATNGAALDAG